MTLPVVWTTEANEDLEEARAWYDNIRLELGERFALAVEVTVEAIAERPLQIPCSLPEPSSCGSAAVSLRNILPVSGAADAGIRGSGWHRTFSVWPFSLYLPL